jgi:hypothetical protein
MARLFTPRYKQRGRVVAAVVTMCAGAAPFVGGLLLLQLLPEERGWLPAAVAGLSFAAGGLLPWVSQNVMGLAGNWSLRRQLGELLRADGATPDVAGASFVGFSPGERLHVWHGETSRDVGFLRVLPEGLVYEGDEFSWRLPRGFIDHVDLTPREAGMQRLLIRWHVPREEGRTFSLEAREARTIAQARQATVVLHRQLREWLRREPGGEDFPAATGLPPTDMSGAQVVEEPAAGSCLAVLAAGAITAISIWRFAGTLAQDGLIYQAILLAGLISVVGALATGYLLHYLQAWEAEHGKRRTLRT